MTIYSWMKVCIDGDLECGGLIRCISVCLVRDRKKNSTDERHNGQYI